VPSLKTNTDNIIEAIFNPVPSSSKTPSPFTYYVAPPPPAPPLLETVDSSDIRSGSASANSSFVDVEHEGSLNTHTTSLSTRSHSRTDSHSSSGDADIEIGPVIAPSRSASMCSAQSRSTSNSHATSALEKQQQRKWWQRLAAKSQPANMNVLPPPPRAPGTNSTRAASPASGRSLPTNVYVTMDDEDNEPVSGLESQSHSYHGHGHGFGGIRRRPTTRSIGQSSISSAGSASRWAAVPS
jgi:hypothetical protein